MARNTKISPGRHRFLGPEITLAPAPASAHMVHGYTVFWDIGSVFDWSQSGSVTPGYNPLIRSARLCDQFSLAKTMDLISGRNKNYVHTRRTLTAKYVDG